MISRILKVAALFFLFVLVVGISAYLTLTFIIKSERILLWFLIFLIKI